MSGKAHFNRTQGNVGCSAGKNKQLRSATPQEFSSAEKMHIEDGNLFAKMVVYQPVPGAASRN